MAEHSERENVGHSSFSVEYRSSTTLLQTLSPVRLGTERGEDSKVTVAVRVRPFSEREKRLGAKQCVFMNGNETSISSGNTVKHRFVYDYSFWSTDNIQSPLATEEHVYKHLAQPLLDWSFDGYNTCLFAYGQTGSGKSYSIMGEGQVVGIVPRFSEELFDRIEGTTDITTHYKVEISYHEIYNERIHDLLASNKRKNKVQLRVREHPVLGPYVEDLSTYVVSSFSDIEYWLSVGNKYRATAATGMNDKSSRSHSVVTIILTQSRAEEGEEMSKVSKINLIDLAGSERSSVAQTTGERLKEGGNINRSLHTLGKVIALLSEKSSGKRKKVFIPYRDSTLTWLLKESLGGNSKTAMIATISPADIHYEESLSTLRYAQQARSIVNIAKINEDPGSRLIRELRAEIERLRGLLSQAGDKSSIDTSSQLAEVQTLRLQLQEGEKLMEECSRSWKEKLSHAERVKQVEVDQLKKAGVSFKVDNRLPNLVNLNEDPQLSEMLLYVIKEGTTVIGQQNPNSTHDIQLTGALVALDHCVIKNEKGTVTISPSDEAAQTFVNGNLITSATVLHHGDRVVVGGDHYFRFNHPVEVAKRGIQRSESGLVARDFEFARNELIEAQRSKLEAEVEEARQKERQKMMEELENVKKALEDEKSSIYSQVHVLQEELKRTAIDQEQREQTRQEATVKVSELEEKNKILEEETALQKRLVQLEKLRAQKEQEELHSYRARVLSELEDEKRKLETHIEEIQRETEGSDSTTDLDESIKEERILEGSELLRISMMVQEANSISRTLARNITLLRDYTQSSQKDNEVRLRVTNTKKGVSVYWTLPKFEERLEQMRDLYQSYLEDGLTGQDSIEEDPFNHPSDAWEENETRLTASGLSLFKKYPHLSAQLSPHVREHLLATVTPLSSPLLREKSESSHTQNNQHHLNALSEQHRAADSVLLPGHLREPTEGGNSCSGSPLLTTRDSPYLRNYTPLGDTARLEGVETPPPVVKLCLGRMTSLSEEVKKLRKQSTRNAMTEVLRSSAQLTGAVSALVETAENYSKLSKGGKVQVPMYETTDVESCCLALSSSAELLAHSLGFLDIEQQQLQSPSYVGPHSSHAEKTAEMFTQTRDKLMDEMDNIVSCVSSILENVSLDKEDEVATSCDDALLSCSQLVQTVGVLSTTRKLHCGVDDWTLSAMCIKDEELWVSELPFSTVQSYFLGVMTFCHDCLTQVAEKAKMEEGRRVTDANVTESMRSLCKAVNQFMESLARHQVNLWQNLLHHVSDGTLPPLPNIHNVMCMIDHLFTCEQHLDQITNQTSDRSALGQVNSQFMSAFTELATSALNVVRSSECNSEAQITSQLQLLTREVMKNSKKLSSAIKSTSSRASESTSLRQRRQSLEELLNDSTSGYEV
jgi:hypothetical protein